MERDQLPIFDEIKRHCHHSFFIYNSSHSCISLSGMAVISEILGERHSYLDAVLAGTNKIKAAIFKLNFFSGIKILIFLVPYSIQIINAKELQDQIIWKQKFISERERNLMLRSLKVLRPWRSAGGMYVVSVCQSCRAGLKVVSKSG